MVVGLLVCRVVAVEVICGGDQSLGHLGAGGGPTSWGLVPTMRSRCSVPFDGVRGFVAWHSALVLSIFDGGRGVSLEEVQGLSRWNIALRHSLWLSLPRRG